MTSVDATHVLHDGPWRHRFVSANGARFHVAEAGAGPLVVLLHGFPQMWWCWRYQLPALAAAGYRVAAMDLRGYGASDKPPRGYDTPTLAADVAAVIRSLGESDAVVVGHDWGGWISWSMPSLEPGVTRAVGAVSMAHPLAMRRSVRRYRNQAAASRYVWAFQLPFRPERRLVHPGTVEGLLRNGSGTDWPGDDEDGATVVQAYTDAMRVPFVAHSSMEYYRWAVRSTWRADGRSFVERVDRPIDVPVLHLQGVHDPAVLAQTARRSGDWARGGYEYLEVPDAGHFLPEERPDVVNAALLTWLGSLDTA
ncbi:alpha/beta fold hydrolase [Angustibacter sp. McL0619]|uniref:alpha/beta fold hydrolase n=1 Tax=Angustibacter sp. McL0619 TaxID=3415676 RepID=UPI003CF1C15A